MSLRVCILGSGSSGNCIFVSSTKTAILIDAGLSAKETERRLAQINVNPASLQAICISHEHSDHTAGTTTLHRRYGIPLYANAGTREGLVGGGEADNNIRWQLFTTGSSFVIGDLCIEPFSVPHDAYEPVGFVIHAGSARLGIATDMGMPTALIRERLRECDAVVIESNHDEEMLANSSRPWFLKQRIRGRQGHLSNKTAADMIADIISPRLRRIFLAHLSSECNCRDLALKTTETKLIEVGHKGVTVSCAFPDKISEMWSL